MGEKCITPLPYVSLTLYARRRQEPGANLPGLAYVQKKAFMDPPAMRLAICRLAHLMAAVDAA